MVQGRVAPGRESVVETRDMFHSTRVKSEKCELGASVMSPWFS